MLLLKIKISLVDGCGLETGHTGSEGISKKIQRDYTLTPQGIAQIDKHPKEPPPLAIYNVRSHWNPTRSCVGGGFYCGRSLAP